MAQALVDQIVEILAVDERGKLKGWGDRPRVRLRCSETRLPCSPIWALVMKICRKRCKLYWKVLDQQERDSNFRSRNPYRKQLEAVADGLPEGFQVD